MNTQAPTRLHKFASSPEPEQKGYAINPKISYNHIEQQQETEVSMTRISHNRKSKTNKFSSNLLVTHLQWDLQIIDRWSLSVERHFEFCSILNLFDSWETWHDNGNW